MSQESFTPDDAGDITFAPDVSARLARALAAAVRHHDASMRELRSALCGCVAELKARNVQPEKMLVTMKEHIRRMGISYPPAGSQGLRWAADEFMEDIVRWCVAEYYRPD